MPNLTHSQKQLTSAASWEGKVTQSNKSSTYHFATAEKYVDEDIDLQVEVNDATTTVSGGELTHGNITTNDSTYLTDSNTGYSITFNNIASVSESKYVVNTPGWISSGEQVHSASGDSSKSLTKYIKAATEPSLSVTANTTDEVTIGTTASSGKYPVSANISAKTTYSSAGWVPASGLDNATDSTPQIGVVSQSTLKNGTTSIDSGTEITASDVTQTINIGAGYYPSSRTVKIKPASSGGVATINAAPSDPGTAYTKREITLASGGWLKIDAGYVGATKISLADLVPDEADIVASESSPYILTGHSAYDKDGNLIAGGINNGIINASATGGTSTGTINRGSQIKIGKGYYENDVYYTAQSNSGDVTITSQSGQSVDGYETATVRLAASPSLSVTENTSTAVSVGTTATSGYYPVSANITAKTTYLTSGWIDSAGLSSASSGLKNIGKIMAGTISNTSAPSGTTTNQLDRGETVKISSGYYQNDTYYQAQSNSGTVTITQKTGQSVDGYSTATVTSGSASVNSNQTILSELSIGSLDTSTNKYTITASGSKTIDASVSSAGWISTVNSASVSTNGTLEIAHAGVPIASLTTTSDTATYPSGYSQVTITAKAGYNESNESSRMDVYQGLFTIS